jgi:3-phosphoshikimate 1-carboxyvinyltransferase
MGGLAVGAAGWAGAWLPRRVVVEPGGLRGGVVAPGSKSYTHRALLVSLLAEGGSLVENPLWSGDTLATLGAVEALGATVERGKGRIRVEPPGGGPRWAPCIDAAESGTTMRLVTGVLGLLGDTVLVYGRGRLHRRPVRPLLEAMAGLGVGYVVSRGCCPPHAVRGPARGGEARVDAGESSQYLSALLLLAAGMGGLRVEALRLESRPYVDMTVRVLEAYGIRVRREGYRVFQVEGRPRGTRYRVPGDWSSAAHLLAAAAAAGGEVRVGGLDPLDPHPDRRVVELLAAAGASCGVSPGGEAWCRSPGPGGLRGFEACVSDSPDLAPALAAAAAVACGVSRICCADRLRLKESDRVEAVLDLAARAGAEAWLERRPGEGLCVAIRGRCGRARPAAYRSHGDHRIAMAAAALALAAEAESVVEDAHVVAKSYPEFWSHLRLLGARIREA